MLLLLLRSVKAGPVLSEWSSPAKDTDFVGFAKRVPLPPMLLLLLLPRLTLLPPGTTPPPPLRPVAMLLRVLVAVEVVVGILILPWDRKLPPSKSGRRSSSPPKLLERDERDAARLRVLRDDGAGDLELLRFLILGGGWRDRTEMAKYAKISRGSKRESTMKERTHDQRG